MFKLAKKSLKTYKGIEYKYMFFSCEIAPFPYRLKSLRGHIQLCCQLFNIKRSR